MRRPPSLVENRHIWIKRQVAAPAMTCREKKGQRRGNSRITATSSLN
jgi:hypothetical protein